MKLNFTTLEDRAWRVAIQNANDKLRIGEAVLRRERMARMLDREHLCQLRRNACLERRRRINSAMEWVCIAATVIGIVVFSVLLAFL